jgi:hypothetical protein
MELFLRPADLFSDPHWGRMVEGLPPDAALLAYYTALGLDPEASAALIVASHAPDGDPNAAATQISASLPVEEIARRVVAAVDMSDLWATRLIRSIAENEHYPARARLDAIRLGLELRDRLKSPAARAVLEIDADALLTLQGHIREQIRENGRTLHLVDRDDAAASG